MHNNVAEHELQYFIFEQKFAHPIYPQKVQEEKDKWELSKIVQSFCNLTNDEQQKYLNLSHNDSIIEDTSVIEQVKNELAQNLQYFSTDQLTQIFSIYKTNAFSNGLFLQLGILPQNIDKELKIIF